jgi:hypothetical protein
LLEGSLQNSSSLLFAVYISISLALIIGIIGAIASVYAVNKFLTYFKAESLHIKRYMKGSKSYAEQIVFFSLNME